MTNLTDFNRNVIRFFETAGWMASEKNESVLVSNQFDLKYFIGWDDDYFSLRRQERAGEQYHVMRSTAVEDIERYLLDEIGNDYRREHTFPEIWLPWDPDSLGQSFVMEDMNNGWFSLVDPLRKEWRAEIEIIGINTAVCFSHIAKISLDDLVSSYESSDGSPALQQFLHID